MIKQGRLSSWFRWQATPRHLPGLGHQQREESSLASATSQRVYPEVAKYLKQVVFEHRIKKQQK
jgi:hypothetical protein